MGWLDQVVLAQALPLLELVVDALVLGPVEFDLGVLGIRRGHFCAHIWLLLEGQ